MRILALVPARGGSKRLPRKNVLVLGGIPLIAWTIRAARESGCCAEVLVSTDDPGVAEVARGCGGVVPWLRPSHLATDASSSVDVALHALDAFEQEQGAVDGLLLLQPTSPFRTATTIRNAVSLFEAHAAMRPIVSLGRAASHPAWCFRVTQDGLTPFLDWPGETRSQELEPAWTLNGSIYLIGPDRLRRERAFLTRDAVPLLLQEAGENLDIDTAADFEMCKHHLHLATGSEVSRRP